MMKLVAKTFLANYLGKPFEAGLSVFWEYGLLTKTLPDLKQRHHTKTIQRLVP